MTEPPDGHSFVIVANRLPIDEVVDPDGTRRWRPSPGGVAPVLRDVATGRRGVWVGWSGRAGAAPEPFTDDGVWLHPVALSERDVEDYYEGNCNSSLWPLYHDCLENPLFPRSWWDAYRRVNQTFADAAAKVAAPGATVWVHDYQLQLVPGMLRQMRPDLRIGFFLHIPFPPVELFMRLPRRTEIVRGMLGADLVGFQRPLAAQNFVQLARHLLGVRARRNTIEFEDRTIRADWFPVSIDVEATERKANDPAIQARARELRAKLNHPRTLLLGFDRLDYTKGIEQRLKAYGELLEEGTLSPEETVFVQVASPTRERAARYRELRERVEWLAGHLNGKYGGVGRSVVHCLHQAFDHDQATALFLAADVMVVTPFRDGMNLVAKAYVASRVDDGGALVLSEFAGAAGELRLSFLCNPFSLDNLKDSIVRAVENSQEENRKRMHAMRSYLRAHDVHNWYKSFLDALKD